MVPGGIPGWYTREAYPGVIPGCYSRLFSDFRVIPGCYSRVLFPVQGGLTALKVLKGGPGPCGVETAVNSCRAGINVLVRTSSL